MDSRDESPVSRGLALTLELLLVLAHSFERLDRKRTRKQQLFDVIGQLSRCACKFAAAAVFALLVALAQALLTDALLATPESRRGCYCAHRRGWHRTESDVTRMLTKHRVVGIGLDQSPQSKELSCH